MMDEHEPDSRLRQQVEQLRERVSQLEAELEDARQVNGVLQDTADWWRVLAESAPAFIMTVDCDGTILFSNHSGPDCRVVGSNVREHVAPEHLSRVLHAIENVFKAGEPGAYEVDGAEPDGRFVRYSVRCGPLKWDDEVVAAIQVATDVTVRRWAEEALSSSAANLNATLEATADGILAVGAQGNVLFSNRRFAELWRIPQTLIDRGKSSALLGYVMGQLSDPDAFIAEVRRLYASTESSCDTLFFKDGRVFERYSFPLQQDDTSAPGRVWSFRDVTARQRADRELSLLRDYLESIIDCMPSVIVGVEPDGRVTLWNSEARRCTGVSAAAALGRPLEQIFPRLAEELPRVREALRMQAPQTGSQQARRLGGETRYEDVTIYPLVAGGVASAVIRVDDVTEKVRIEEMMVQSEKMHSVGVLAAGVAHEINNPLAGMIQTAGVIADRLTDPELPANKLAAEAAGTTMEAIGAYLRSRRIVDMLSRVRESGIRAAAIVANLLSFAQRSDERSAHSLAGLLDQCVELATADYELAKTLDFRRIRIVWEREADLPLVPCDPGKIRQVLLNILRNGAEAMHAGAEGGRPPEPCFVFRLAHERAAGMVRIEIEDNGPGMDEEIRRRVFEPFFSTKPTGGGLGLGLSVAYFIITESHGGKLSVESTRGRGTKLIIRLPVAEAQGDSARR